MTETDHVLEDLVRLSTGEWQPTDEELASLADQLAESEELQVALALLLHAGSQTEGLDDQERANFAQLFKQQAAAMRGRHIEEDEEVYAAYQAEWQDTGRPPTSPRYRHVRRHLARCEACRKQLLRRYTEAASLRITEHIERAKQKAQQAAEAPEPAESAASSQTAPSQPQARIVPAPLPWRSIARSGHAVELTRGMRVTDYETFDIALEGVAEGELTVLGWGPDDLHHGRRRAVKLLRPMFQQVPAMRAAFEEAILAWCHAWPRAKNHAPPQLVHVPRFDDAPALLFDYAHRGNLRTVLRHSHAGQSVLTPQQAFAYAHQIAAALAALHSNRLIHGDPTPANVLIAPDESVWLSDVGLSRVWAAAPAVNHTRLHVREPLSGPAGPSSPIDERGAPADLMGDRGDETQSFSHEVGSRGPVVGEAQYMAPERWLGIEALTAASDVYALGVMLFEIFAGTAGGPFVPPPHSSAGWFHAHRTGPTRSLLSDDTAALTRGPLAQLIAAAQPARRGDEQAVAEETLYALDLLIRQCLAPLPADRPTADAVRDRLHELAERAGCVELYAPHDAPVDDAIRIDHLHRLGHTYRRVSRPTHAPLPILLQTAREAPRPEAWSSLGSALYEEGHHEAALEAFAAAASLMPEEHHAPGHPVGGHLAFHRANTYQQLNRHDEAIEHYRKTLQHDNEHAAALYGISVSLAHKAYEEEDPLGRRDRLAEAHDAVQRAAELAPDNPDVRALRDHLAEALGDLD